MKTLDWFDRIFIFGLPKEMLPFYLERLEGSIYRIEAKVKGVNDKVLSEKYDDKWSVKQNIGHLAEIDVISNRRIDEMRSGAATLSPAVFEPKGDYNAMPISKVIEIFREARWSNINKYNVIAESDLLKSSTHPRLKVQLTPVDLAFFDAEHDDHHIFKISRIIAEHQ